MAGIRMQAPAWACVHTYPQAELYAQANLRAKGYETWLPLVAVRRRDRVVRTMFHTVEVPAWSRYVLVLHQPDEPWTPIRYTEGVHELLKMDGKPTHTSGEAVEAVRAALAAGGPADTGKQPYRPGAALKWRHRAYHGLDAIVVSSDHHSTTVAVVMLGHLRHVTVPTADLVPRD